MRILEASTDVLPKFPALSGLFLGGIAMGQRVLQECWCNAKRWLASVSAAMGSAMPGQRVLQECWRSAQLWLTSI
jgi:hypothetical protein